MKLAHASLPIRCAQGAALCVALVLASCDSRKSVETPPVEGVAAPQADEQLALGAEVYQTTCANCHYAGEAGPSTPALAGSAALGAEPSALFKIILQGQRNVSIVNGQKLNGIMPGMAYLSDEEIAAVSMYLRQRFGGGQAEPIAPAAVAAERKKLGVD
jgi:mono/diheme cytochrome c family protein